MESTQSTFNAMQKAHDAAEQFCRMLHQQPTGHFKIYSDADIEKCHYCGFSRLAHTNKLLEFGTAYSPCESFQAVAKLRITHQ